MALRESETFTHNVANGQYSGTATQIARALRKNSEHFIVVHRHPNSRRLSAINSGGN